MTDAPKPGKKPRGRPRVITWEVARKIADTFDGPDGDTHSVMSASALAGVLGNTVHVCIGRYVDDIADSDEAHDIGKFLYEAWQRHIHRLRTHGFVGAESDGRGHKVSWIQYMLEHQAPAEHPRKTAVELTGANGGAIKHEDVGNKSAADIRAELEALRAQNRGE